jgi:hypothetical protein
MFGRTCRNRTGGPRNAHNFPIGGFKVNGVNSNIDGEEEEGDVPGREPQRPSDPELRLWRTQSELAQAMNVGRRTVCDWLAGGAPGKRDCGRYDEVLVRNWLRVRGAKICPTCHRPMERR